MQGEERKKVFFTIPRKIILVVLFFVCLIFIVLSNYVVSSIQKLMFSEFEKRAHIITQTFALNCEYDLMVYETDDLQQKASHLLETSEEVISIIIYDAQDREIVNIGQNDSREYKKYESSVFVDLNYKDTAYSLFLKNMLAADDGKEYLGKCALFFSLDEHLQNVARIRDIAILIFFLFGVVMTGVLTIAMKLFLGRYLTRLLNAIFRISEGDLTYQVDIDTDDEMGVLAEAFNNMAKEISNSQNKILETKKYNENIIYSMGESLIVIGEDDNIEVVNNEATYLLGYSSHEIIGKSFFDFVAFRGSNSGDYEKLINFISTGEAVIRNLELFFINKEGKQVPVKFSGSIMYQDRDDSENAKRRIVAICSDMRKTKELIDELKNANEKLENFSRDLEGQVVLRTQEVSGAKVYIENILKNFLDLLIVTDSNGVVKEVNKIAATVFGCEESEIIGCSISDFIKGDSFLLDEVFKEKRIENKEIVLKRKDGASLPVLLSASLMATDQKDDESIVIIAKDISIIKQTEEMLLYAKERAEKASKAKSFFLANMSHEIRTPINSVVGFAEILKETKLDNLQKDYVRTIEESSKILISLINDILDVSKIESGEMVLEKIDFNMEFLIENVIKMMTSRIIDNNVELIFYYHADVEQYFMGDSNRLSQVFINLLGNAVKFTKEGQIMVRVIENSNRNDISPDNASLLISIKDTGIGIPKNKISSVFERFVQADESTTRNFGGTGLGLSIVKVLIEKMGGKIQLNSKEGQGSEFLMELVFPKANEAMRNNSVEFISYASHRDVLNGLKAVILNEVEDLQYVIHSYCSDWGVDVVKSFYNPGKAFSWLDGKLKEIDVVFIDISIADFDFHKPLKRIKKNNSAVKIVSLCYQDTLYSVKEQYSGLIDCFISKPVFREKLFKTLAYVMKGIEIKAGILPEAVKDDDQSRFKDVRILLAEDNLNNLKLMEILLKKIGCSYELAQNGKIAVEMMQQGQYDLVFMDIQMPVMNGIEATLHMRQELQVDIPIVALSAAVMNDEKKLAKKAGVDDYLEKPVNIKHLRKSILKWVVNKSNNK